MVGLSEFNMQIQSYLEANPQMLTLLIVVLVWKLIWYGLALYNSIELKQKSWFTILFVGAFILNDLGILPIIYLIIYRDKTKQNNKQVSKSDSKKSKKIKRR